MNKIFIASLLFCSLFIQVTQAQHTPVKAYLHLNGGIEGGVKVSMNLIKTGDTLFGDFAYALADYTRGTFDINVGEYANIYGKMLKDGSFWLKEWGNEKGPLITGTFNDERTLSGYWEFNPGSRKLPFMLSERMVSGSLPFQVFFLNDKKLLSNTSGSPSAVSKQCILLPAPSVKGRVADSIRRIILSNFSGKPEVTTDPDTYLKNLQKQFFAEYISSNEAMYKQMPDAGSLNWVLLRMMHILYNDKNFLSFYILTYTFTGGAHGLESKTFTVVSATDARVIKLSDIFMHGFESGVSDLLTQKLKAMQGLNDKQKLSENGYFVDVIDPNDNFFLTNHGVGFHYDPYEIAPYSNGSTVIFLPFTDLAPYLKDGGVIRELIGE